MLIRRPTLDAIAAGRVTVVFRRWERPRVRAGSRQRTAVGVLEVVSVDAVEVADLTAADARAAGFADLAALHRAQRDAAIAAAPLYRIGVRLAGPDRGCSCAPGPASTTPNGPS